MAQERKPLIQIEVDTEHKEMAACLAKKKGLTLAAYVRSLLYERLEEEATKAA